MSEQTSSRLKWLVPTLSALFLYGFAQGLVKQFIGEVQPARYVLYFFFATTCQACKNNMPNWNNLMDTLSHQRVRIVGLSPDSLFRIRELLAHVPAKFPVFSVVPDLPKLKKYKLTIFPSTILVEPSGVVKRLWGGLLSDEKMKEILYATM